MMLAVPATLEDRALDWFGSNVWPPEAMRLVEAWFECLQEFAIDIAKARKEANACTYDPTRHRIVMDYFVLIMLTFTEILLDCDRDHRRVLILESYP